MRYSELESTAYELLRRGDTIRAKVLVYGSLSNLLAQEYSQGLVLFANVLVCASPIALDRPLELVRTAIADLDLPMIARFKAHLLGAAVGRMAGWLAEWQYHLGAMQPMLTELSAWRGRYLRSWAHYDEATADLSKAVTQHAEVADWHKSNTGPYDERDDLCYVALTYNDLSRLYLDRNAVELARDAAVQVTNRMPPDASQRVYAHICWLRYHLAMGDTAEAGRVLVAADQCMSRIPNAMAQSELDRLRVSYLSRTGRHTAAQELLNVLRRNAMMLRNVNAIRQLESIPNT